MKLRLEWNEKFSVGIPEIDAQHKVLFDIANSIPEEPDERKVRTCIVRIFKYCREHFSFEEETMRKMEYPKDSMDEHARIHEQLIDRLSQVATMPLNTIEANEEFKRFTVMWITEHILGKDQEFGEFAKHQR